MTPIGATGRRPVEEAHRRIRRATPLVLAASAETLHESIPLLEEAAEHLSQAQHSAPHPGQAAALQEDLARLGLLLKQAGEFYAGWLEQRGVLENGYTASGSAAAFRTEGSLSVEG
jgi:hypothetical protein